MGTTFETRRLLRQPVLFKVAFIVLAVDLATKAVAVSTLAIHVRNDRMLLGIGGLSRWWLAVASVGITVGFGGLAQYAIRRGMNPWFGGLILGGMAANVVDRLVTGAVHDWIPVGNIAANLADIAIPIGLIGLLTFVIRLEPRASTIIRSQRTAQTNPTSPRISS